MRRTLFATGLVLGLSVVVAAQPPALPPAMPPALPAINPAVARLDATLGRLDGPGFALAVNGPNNILAAACEGGTVRYWLRDVIVGVRANEWTSQALAGHRGPVTALTWVSADRLATGGVDKRILLWRMPEGELLQTLPAGAAVRALAATPDGKWLASAEDGTVRLWGADPSKGGQKLDGPTDWQHCLAFSADGNRLAAGGCDGRLRIWEVATAKKLIDVPASPPLPPAPPGTAAALPNVIHSVAFRPDGKEVAAGCADDRIHLFSADGKLVRSLTGHASSVSTLAYHPAGTILVSGSKDGTVKLWNAANGQLLKNLEGHTAWVQGVVLLEKGTRLASVGADQSVRLWELR